MSEYVDATRIAELQDILGADTQAILASMLTSMTGAIDKLEASVAAGELDQAIQAAHRARNDALMLSADRLQAALTELELAAREADEPRTRDALERVRAVWPPTREELAGVARAT
ncbi:MAG TPA: Hpt domain-containing protein [Solirubrobacteraceae bacterium]|nr:Hpt domain-containing protein [Solirubrobacteraceae bacterium]